MGGVKNGLEVEKIKWQRKKNDKFWKMITEKKKKKKKKKKSMNEKKK